MWQVVALFQVLDSADIGFRIRGFHAVPHYRSSHWRIEGAVDLSASHSLVK